MEQTSFRVYPYRWVMLLAFMLVVALNQLLWITFASITAESARFYGVTDLSIGLLSLVFLVVYIFVSVPASWIIDTYGVRVGVGIGAGLTGIFGLLRGIGAPSYTLVLVSQIGIAVGQPFILNAVTTVAARWFPIQARATAAGLGSLAIYLGILTGLLVTPFLALQLGIVAMLLAYGVAAMIGAAVFLIAARERPPTPPCPPGQEQRSLVVDGLRGTFHKPDFILLMIVFFVGLGVFNAVTTWIEEIVKPSGFSVIDAGTAGGLMIVGGILGALVIPSLSDRYRKRTTFLILAVVGATVGLLGVTFASTLWLLLASSFILGFFLLSAGPIGFQYGAEITYPAPEGTSNGLLLLMGQVSGILFILWMDGSKDPLTGSMRLPLIALAALMVFSVFLCLRLKEAPGLVQVSA